MRKLLTWITLLLCMMLCLPAGAEGLMEAVQLAEPAVIPEDQLLFSFIGDCTTGEDYFKRGYGSSYTSVVGKLGMDWPMSLVKDMFAADDLTFANCEVTYTAKRPVKQSMALMASPEWANVLKLGNVDVVNMFNNHTLDFGNDARYDTRAALDAVGIAWSDRSAPYITEVKGVKLALISLCSAMRKDQMNELRDYLSTMRTEQGVNFIILSCHWGYEDSYTLRGDQLRAHEFLDMGADMIWGHGSHTLQPIEYYNGKLIFYSTCNFTFGANGSPKDQDTAVFQVNFRINEDKSVTPASLKVFPFQQCKERDFRPYPVTNETIRLRIFRKLYAVPSRESKTDSHLPESFLQTGEVDLLAWAEELSQAAAE